MYFVDLDSCKVEDMTSLKQAVTPRDILRVLKNNKLFTPSDVICMQYILKRTDCPDLFTNCLKYAEQQNALCFYEKPLGNSKYTLKVLFIHYSYLLTKKLLVLQCKFLYQAYLCFK